MEISIKDLIRIFKNGLWIMLISGVVCALVAFGYSKFFIQKTYMTTVKLYVETTASGNSSYNDMSAYNYAAALVNTYIEMFQTNNFYKMVSENLDNKFEASEISSMLRFENKSETEVFSAIITGNSPEEAKLVADSVADVAPGVISTLENANLKIVDHAVLPTQPASPNVLKNTVIFGALGLILAFIYVFVKELLDVKIKYNSEMITLNNIPILAAIPDFESTDFSPASYFSDKMRYAATEEKEEI